MGFGNTIAVKVANSLYLKKNLLEQSMDFFTAVLIRKIGLRFVGGASGYNCPL